MTKRVRCVGIADADARLIDRFVARAAERGLQTVAAATVAVAFDGDAIPRVQVARHGDGSFAVLDGEAFGSTVEGLLVALRAGTAAEVSFEGSITWWDARRGVAAVLGDQVGAVPLAYGRVESSAVWSTEHGDLVAAGVAPVPDPEAIAMLAAIGWVPPPFGYLLGTESLAAGRMLTITPGRTPIVSPWFLHTAEPPGDGEAIADALVRAIDRRATATRLGMFLSAGIDSTAIVAVLRRVLDVPVETFTFRYLGYEGEHNEDEFAAETARIVGAPHTTIPVSPSDLADRFSDLVRQFRSPVSFGVHSFKQDAVRDAGVDVLLTGADPGGWYDYGGSGVVASRLWRLSARNRLAVQRAAGALHRIPKVDAVYWSAVLANHAVKSEYAALAERRALVGESADRASRRYADALGALARDVDGEAPRHRATFVTQTVRRYAAEWNTRFGRAFGCPIRAPYFDPAVALAIDRRRPWDAHEKTALRDYTATLVPHERAYAPKIYQELPLAQWLRGPLRDFVGDALSRERVDASGTMAYEPLRRMLDEHLAGTDRKWPLWQLMSTVEWGLQLREPVDALRG